MRRIFKTRYFARLMKKSGATDTALEEAVHELSQGLHDGDIGGHIYKKRVALPGMGKRGSARTLIATRSGQHWFFVFGFKKNERANISAAELKALQQLATNLLAQNRKQLTKMLNDGALEEIIDGKAKA